MTFLFLDLNVSSKPLKTYTILLILFYLIIFLHIIPLFKERDSSRGVSGVCGEAWWILGQEGHSFLLLEGEGQTRLWGECLILLSLLLRPCVCLLFLSLSLHLFRSLSLSPNNVVPLSSSIPSHFPEGLIMAGIQFTSLHKPMIPTLVGWVANKLIERNRYLSVFNLALCC